MSQDKTSFEIAKGKKLQQLYENLHEALGPDFKYERFLGWINQYLRPSREFHGLSHLLAMSELNEGLTEQSGPKSAAVYSMVAGFFHDEDYPSTAEGVTHMSKRFVDKYVEERDGKAFLKPIEPDDRIGQMLVGIFGFKEGQQLSPFPFPGNPGGMNEFYCAVAAAGEMQELGKDEHFIAAVTAAIEATIPFRKPERMNELRARIEATNDKLGMNLTASEIDEIMVASVHTANKDVIGFLGGLDPADPAAVPTTQSVLQTIKGGDMLSPEEVPTLRTKGLAPDKGAGDYSPRDFLNARIKRAGLYHLVLAGDPLERKISNLFYETKLSGGNTYPPHDWVDKAGKLAYENNLPVRTAEYARLISAGIVNALTELSTDKPEDVKVRGLLSKLHEIMQPSSLPPEASHSHKLAMACVNGREQAGGHDVRRSAIAEFIVSKLSESEIEALGKASRDVLLPQPLNPAQIEALNKNFSGVYQEGDSKAQTFLNLATEYLGKGVEKIRDDIARSAGAGDNTKAIAARMRNVKLPPVREH